MPDHIRLDFFSPHPDEPIYLRQPSSRTEHYIHCICLFLLIYILTSFTSDSTNDINGQLVGVTQQRGVAQHQQGQ